MDQALTIFLSIFGGGGLITLVQFLVNRHDAKKGELASIKKEIGSLREEIREDQATTARVRILQFSDQMLHGEKHSKESFEQALQDIDKYVTYTRTHPNYANARAKAAIAHISSVYQDCLMHDNFLK